MCIHKEHNTYSYNFDIEAQIKRQQFQSKQEFLKFLTFLQKGKFPKLEESGFLEGLFSTLISQFKTYSFLFDFQTPNFRPRRIGGHSFQSAIQNQRLVLYQDLLFEYNSEMLMRQRQEESKAKSIEGKKIIKNITYIKKEIRTLSPQLYEPILRQQTFQTDSFKEILTKRSGSHLASKQNISLNNKKLKQIKEEEGNPHKEKNKKNALKSSKSGQKKKHSVPSQKIMQRDRLGVNEETSKNRKSYSPSRDYKEYKSGPADKKNYISNNISSKTSRQGILPSKSQRNLTDRIGKNPLATFFSKSAKAKKKSKEKILGIQNSEKNAKKKKQKNTSKTNLSLKQKVKKEGSKVEDLAREFDSLVRQSKVHKSIKNEHKKQKKQKKKSSEKKSKSKHVILSNQHSLANLTSQKNKIVHISEYSSDSSPERNLIMLNRYKHDDNSKNKVEVPHRNGRHSFQPASQVSKTRKQLNKIKTQQFSPQKLLIREINRNQAVLVLQKNIRRYLAALTLKKEQIKLQNICTIEQKIQGFISHSHFIVKAQRKKQQENKRDSLQIQSQRCKEIMGAGFQIKQLLENRQMENTELINLLQEILKEQKVSRKMKQKIQDFLITERSGKNSARSSIHSHSELQILSERRFFEKHINKMNKNNQYLLSPEAKILKESHTSPKINKEYFSRSPQLMIDNLQTIKQIQREKIIIHANMQREGIDSLAMKQVFSPNTQSLKKKEIDQKMQEDLERFDRSIEEVIKIAHENDDGEIKEVQPFIGILTPQRLQKNSPEPLSGSQKFQDQSMQLLEYYDQKTHLRTEHEYEPLDNTFQFIEMYEINLCQFLRQKGPSFIQNFLNLMNSYRNLQPQILLKNFHLVTEDSQDDISFKLPMYKYLENQDKELISVALTEQFNQQYSKLKRHHFHFGNNHKNIQQIYLKMLVDCFNQALNNERPVCYLFTETSLINRKNKHILNFDFVPVSSKNIEAENNESENQFNNNEDEQRFEIIFVKAMNQIFAWANLHAGITENSEMDEENLLILNEKRFRDLSQEEAEKKWEYYDELLQIITGIQAGIVEHLFFQAIYEIQFRS